MSRSRVKRRNRNEVEIARHLVLKLIAGNQTTQSVARRARLRGRSIVNITEDVRKYAAEQAISEEDALKKGMEEESKKFGEAGVEVYTKA